MQKKIVRLNVLSDETLDDFLESIGWHIFPKIEYDIQNFREQTDKKNVKERENLVSDMLTYLKDKFMPFFNNYVSFPYANMNYLDRRVKISRVDINKYFENTNRLSTDVNDLIVTKLNYHLFEGVEKDIVEIDSQEKLMSLLLKDWEETEYTNKYSHIKAVFGSLAMYCHLRYWYRPNMKEPEEIKRESESDKLKDELHEHGFFNLTRVKVLSEQGKKDLVELIRTNNMAYGISMFEYLGFCRHIDDEQGTKKKADLILSKLFNANAKGGTQSRHYRSSLIKHNTKYTSYLHEERVKTDYKKLK